MKRTIYVFWDNKAEDIVGSTAYIFAHDAVAVRMFTDTYNTEGTIFRLHPEDYDLRAIGTLEGTVLVPHERTVITGAALAAAQQQPREGH